MAEPNRERVDARRQRGVAAVSGGATGPAVLVQAHIAEAAMLVITTPHTLGLRQFVATARHGLARFEQTRPA